MHILDLNATIHPKEAGHVLYVICHMAMEYVAYNVYVRLCTFNLDLCSYGACGRSTVVLSSKLTSLSSNLNCYRRRKPA